MQLNRTIPPVAERLRKIPLPAFESYVLSNGIPVYTLHYGNADVVDIRLLFDVGSAHCSKAGMPRFMFSNLQEGTASYSSLALAERLDEYGAWISPDLGGEHSSIGLTSLKRHLPNTLPLLREVAFFPTFPEEEFEKMRIRSFQKLKVQEEKTKTQASRNFSRLMFGKAHPYGRSMNADVLRAISLEEGKEFYQSYFHVGNARIVVVGNFEDDEVRTLLEKNFGSLPKPENPLKSTSLAIGRTITPGKGLHYFEMGDMQGTVRMGHLAFKRKHPDFYPMAVVNTILGGYFGSRLMQNIREDKGYTYGIYSGWVAMRHTGFFVVQTDVGNAYIKPTIEEVHKEIQRLRTELVPEEELMMVKNYMFGQTINHRETPFQLGDLIKFSVMNDIPFSEIDKKFDIIESITAEDVLRLAQTYLKPEDMLEVVCGRMD